MKNPVLPSLEPLLSDLRYVKINEKRISELAQEIAKQELKIPEWREDVFPDKDDKDTINFFFLGNTINFAFTDFDTGKKFETFYKKRKWKGAFAMFACLKRALDKEIPLLEPEYLKILDRTGMRRIFTGNIEIPMLDERLEIFHETGSVLGKKYKSFYNLCKEANFYAFDKGKGIVERLAKDFPSFNDVSIFTDSKGEKHKLLFYKRAQLAVAQCYGRLQDTKEFPLQDVDELTVAADYRLPVSLCNFGILEYETGLEEKIQKGKLIEPDSREELEIRGCTPPSARKLVKEINKYLSKNNSKKINDVHVDAYLWFSGKGKHHLCKTIDY